MICTCFIALFCVLLYVTQNKTGTDFGNFTEHTHHGSLGITMVVYCLLV